MNIYSMYYHFQSICDNISFGEMNDLCICSVFRGSIGVIFLVLISHKRKCRLCYHTVCFGPGFHCSGHWNDNHRRASAFS